MTGDEGNGWYEGDRRAYETLGVHLTVIAAEIGAIAARRAPGAPAAAAEAINQIEQLSAEITSLARAMAIIALRTEGENEPSPLAGLPL